jgi:endonuclease/exonuclease/phosphatase family metal-dependent hydrolase
LGRVRLRVLTWNLLHGRSVPSAGGDLFDAFAVALDGWEWDLALLQEVPPWWPEALGARLRSEYRLALTSRNALPGVRQALARRWPDVMKSHGGGANAILARRDRIMRDRVQLLCRRPERRVAHGVLLGCGVWVVNLHATAHDTVAAQRDGAAAADAARQWAGGDPVIAGGDFNLREPEWPGFERAAGHDVDHIFLGGGLQAVGPGEVLDRGALSDHAPVAVDVSLSTGEPGDRGT